MENTGAIVSAAEAALLAAKTRGGTQNERREDGGADQRVAQRADPRTPRTSDPVHGACYVATYSSAIGKGWKMIGVRPLGRQGEFVEVEESWRGLHRVLQVPRLDEDFRQKPIVPEIAAPSTQGAGQASSDETEYIFPDIDRIPSRALASPKVLVQQVVGSGWLCNSEALGPITGRLEDTFGKMEGETAWQSLSSGQREVQKFAALLTAAQVESGRGECSLWMVCPVIAEQLLRSIQHKICGSKCWVDPST